MSENYAVAGRGLKRFRDALLAFVIDSLQVAYGDSWREQGVKRCFKSEYLDKLKGQFERRYGKSIPLVDRPGSEWYEIFGISDLRNLLEGNWQRVFAQTFQNDRTLLTWLGEITNLRNVVAHPETGDLRYDDVWRGLDSAERILHVFDEKAASEVAAIKGSLRKPEEPIVSVRQWVEYCQSLVNDHSKWTEMLVPPEALTFVPARLGPAERAEPYYSWRYPHYAARTAEAEPVPLDDCVRRYRDPLVILGGPGQGKTAALELLALKHARKVIEQDEELVPVLVKLNRYEQKTRDLLTLILMSIQSRGLMIEAWQMEQLLGNPGVHLLLMFDGLDEVKTSERLGVRQDMESLLLSYPSQRAIITCRTAEYDTFALRLEGEEGWELCRFDEEEVRRFLIDYFWHFERTTQRGRLLFEQLSQQGLMDFAQTPLHLGLIVGLAQEQERLPENKGQLYQQFVDMVLRLEAEKGKAPAEWMQIERFLAHLALVMHQQETRQISLRAARQAIGQYWRELWDSGVCSLRLDEVVDLVWNSRLLVKSDVDAGFRHAILQDYFAAKRLEYMVEDAEEDLYRYVGDPHWDEAFALFAGMVEDASGLVEFVSRKGSPLLTLKCLANARRVDAFARMMAVERLLDQLFDQSILAAQFTRLILEVPSLLKLADELRDHLVPVWASRLLSDEPFMQEMAILYGVCTGPLGEQALTAALDSAETERERARSAFFLGFLGSEESVDPLVGCLHDENPELRYFAVQALGRRGDPKVIEALKPRLSDTDSDVRQVTITVLGALCGADVSPPPTSFLEATLPLTSHQQVDGKVIEEVKEWLQPSLSDPDNQVRTEAAIVLGCLGQAHVADQLIWLLTDDEFDDHQKGRVLRALGHVGTEQTTDAIAGFYFDSPTRSFYDGHPSENYAESPIHFEITAALVLHNTGIMGPLLQSVGLWRAQGFDGSSKGSGDKGASNQWYRLDRLRWYRETLAPAIVGMGMSVLHDLFECIEAAKDGGYPDVVGEEAERLLDNIRKSADVDELIRYLGDAARRGPGKGASWRHSSVEYAIYLIGEHCASWIVMDEDPLLTALTEDDALVELFIDVYQQSDWDEIRFTAARALAHYVRLVGRDTPLGAKICGEVIEPWLKVVDTEHEREQYARGLILSLCGDVQAEPLLRGLLDSPEIETRYKAAYLLLRYHGDEGAIGTIIDMLHHEDTNWRIAAASALEEFDAPEVIAAYADVLHEPDKSVRLIAVRDLAKRGDESVVEALGWALSDEDFSIRDQAIRAFGKIGGRRAVEALSDVVFYHEDESARRSALEALANIGDPAGLDAFRRALKDGDSSVEFAASSELGSWVRSESDVSHLRQLYDVMKEDEGTHGEVHGVGLIVQLGNIGTPEAIRAIEDVLQDPDDQVRYIAIVFLHTHGTAEAVPALSRVEEEDTGVFQDTPLADAARKAIEEIRKREHRREE